MSSNSYDASQNALSPIAGTPKSQLNEAIAKAEASLNNQAKHIEAGNVATVAHSAGDFIIYGSSKQFAKVTQAIAVGSSIADGVNVDNTTEGEILTALNNGLLNMNTALPNTEMQVGSFFNKLKYRRYIDIGDGSSYGLSFNATTQTAAVNLNTLFGFNSNYEVIELDTKVFRTDGGKVYFNNNFVIDRNTQAEGPTQVVAWYNSSTQYLTINVGSQYNVSGNRNVQKIVIMIEYTKEKIW